MADQRQFLASNLERLKQLQAIETDTSRKKAEALERRRIAEEGGRESDVMAINEDIRALTLRLCDVTPEIDRLFNKVNPLMASPTAKYQKRITEKRTRVIHSQRVSAMKRMRGGK